MQLQQYWEVDFFLFLLQKACNKVHTYFSHVQIFCQYEWHWAKWNVHNIRYFFNHQSSVCSNDFIDFQHIFICCGSLEITCALFIFSWVSTTTKTFKPLIYCLSTHSSIFISHCKQLISSYGVLPSSKQNFVFILCSLQCAINNYLHIEWSRLKLVGQMYSGG
jgi:hypothetical protein